MNGNYKLLKTLFIISISLLAGCIIIFPLIPSIDSVAGFLTYKGSLATGKFNYYTEVSPEDLSKDDSWFVSWWSPGQWFFPAVLNYFFRLPLGISSIVITVLSAVCGLFGFYKLFRFFKFDKAISVASLLLIIASYTFFYSFIVYQGGEILSFATFPWFAFAALKSNRPSYKNLLLLFVLFLLCFFAKTTLLIYCLMVLVFKTIIPVYKSNDNAFNYSNLISRSFFIVPGIAAILVIYFFFLSRGATPPMNGRPELSTEDILVPLASPLLSNLSLQQLILKITDKPIYYNVCLGLITILIFILFWRIALNKKLQRDYKIFFSVVYCGIVLFFILIYLLNIPVDYSSRHFKILGYLLIPGLLSFSWFKRIKLFSLTLIIVMIEMLFFVYIKNGWIRDRFVSDQYFYRNFDNKDIVDSVDKQTYNKLMNKLDSLGTKNDILYIEGNPDLQMDFNYRVITQRPLNGELKIYKGNGPRILACVEKQTYYNAALAKTFPGYGKFKLIGETEKFVFLISAD